MEDRSPQERPSLLKAQILRKRRAKLFENLTPEQTELLRKKATDLPATEESVLRWDWEDDRPVDFDLEKR